MKEKNVFYEPVMVLGICSNIRPAGPSVLVSYHRIIFTVIRVFTEKVKEGQWTTLSFALELEAVARTDSIAMG